jgi:hypothetical protein
MAKWVFIVVVAGIFVVPLFMPNWLFFRLTGAFKPKQIIETLVSPLRIVAVNESGLITSEGKLLTLPGVPSIPKQPRIAKDILDYGIELNTNGSTYALIHVHHWCGNDPVRFHLARVDLSSLYMATKDKAGASISEYGISPGLLGIARLPHEEVEKIYQPKEIKETHTVNGPERRD